MYRYFVVTIVAVSVVVWFVISALASRSVEQAVSRDAVDKALHWGTYMSSRIPDLQGLLETGLPSESQTAIIRDLRQLGDVFRFKLFDADGRLVLISDETFISDPQGIAVEYDPEPLDVIQRGTEIVDVFDGSEKPDRPDLYAEAYVPITDRDGRTIGVVEVYVDETLTRQYFSDSFKSFGLSISVLSALLFLIPALAFALQRKVTERSRSKADYLSKFDVLTGLLNRAEFTHRAETLIKEQRLTALLFLDADKFKAINDTHGHAVGDKYLEQIACNLVASTDAGDLVCRFGGDEFVVGLRNANQETVVRRVRKILKLCAKPIDIGDRTLTGSVSIGVSFLEPDMGLEKATAQADAALYYAKSAGRNQYALYGGDMGKEISRRNQLEARIREAAEKKAFTLHYQPLVNGADQELVGYEALMRLELTDGTSIPPSEFIPLAEEIGVIDTIGEWAIYEATQKVAQLPGSPKVAINLSAAQFRSSLLPKIVADALSVSGLPPERLELEVTESLLLDDNTNVAFQIDALHEMGVSVAMDDFGTGFSSLGYLWKYGFDRIKIDRSFVSGLEDNPERSLEIIESVVLLGKRLGMQITAEGVETDAQSEVLSRLGCDVLQGYLYGRPATLETQDVASASFKKAGNAGR